MNISKGLMRGAALALTIGFAACVELACAADPPHETLEAFPQSPLTIESSGKRHLFEVWVADTTPHRSQGLMFVKQLPANMGMLFLFGEPQPVSMWMKNTFIPLDMLFIGADGRIIRIAQNATPHSLATIASMGAASAVLEIAGGESARLGIAPGDRVEHPAFTAP